ncbi:putative electron transport protein [Escherichia coli]|uniref:Putative electron transport protein n=1 Tax=Escherichia coli TaxID=562 RepID=A0A376UC36_ECOLX|nr:putative electron transport protein [Escherichia coli]
MAENKRTRWQRRPGTTGGKLPWNNWRNATTWRKATQLLLLAMNIYIAITFWYWVRYYETANSTTFVARPGSIEGWLPIAGLMNLKYSLTTGQLPSVHAARCCYWSLLSSSVYYSKRPFAHGYARLVRFLN